MMQMPRTPPIYGATTTNIQQTLDIGASWFAIGDSSGKQAQE